MAIVRVISGFSLLNRSLLYGSSKLAPLQFAFGIGNNFPSNMGFLAYNWYIQWTWYRAIRNHETLDALSLLPAHLNLTLAVTYLGGITSGNIYMAVLLVLGTVGAIILSTVTAWACWATVQKDGFQIYDFFFFGWQSFSPGWHRFFLVWQIFDTSWAIGFTILGIILSIETVRMKEPDEGPHYVRQIITLPGYVGVVLLLGPFILWTELIVSRNHIVSNTDWTAMWLFIAQLIMMSLVHCSTYWKYPRGRS